MIKLFKKQIKEARKNSNISNQQSTQASDRATNQAKHGGKRASNQAHRQASKQSMKLNVTNVYIRCKKVPIIVHMSCALHEIKLLLKFILVCFKRFIYPSMLKKCPQNAWSTVKLYVSSTTYGLSR